MRGRWAETDFLEAGEGLGIENNSTKCGMRRGLVGGRYCAGADMENISEKDGRARAGALARANRDK